MYRVINIRKDSISLICIEVSPLIFLDRDYHPRRKRTTDGCIWFRGVLFVCNFSKFRSVRFYRFALSLCPTSAVISVGYVPLAPSCAIKGSGRSPLNISPFLVTLAMDRGLQWVLTGTSVGPSKYPTKIQMFRETSKIEWPLLPVSGVSIKQSLRLGIDIFNSV